VAADVFRVPTAIFSRDDGQDSHVEPPGSFFRLGIDQILIAEHIK
jgi:hypothetical protein